MTEEQVDEIFRQVAAGEINGLQAAAALGLGRTTYHKMRKARGVYRPDGARKRQHAETEKVRLARLTAAQAVNHGKLTFQEAKTILKVSKSTLQNWIATAKQKAIDDYAAQQKKGDKES